MSKRHPRKWFWIDLAAALGAGALGALLTGNGFERYQRLAQPPLSPPMWLFPAVWTALYVLMAVGAFWVQRSASPLKRPALWLYGVQLFFNFGWTPLFFRLEWRLFAFFWLLALLVLVSLMTWLFRRVHPPAAWLQSPYLLWLLFAAYLNLGAWLLNG